MNTLDNNVKVDGIEHFCKLMSLGYSSDKFTEVTKKEFIEYVSHINYSRSNWCDCREYIQVGTRKTLAYYFYRQQRFFIYEKEHKI